MSALAFTLALFVGSHFLVSSTRLRPWLVARAGLRTYLALYSAVALGLFVWAVFGYRTAPFLAVWSPPAWTALVPLSALPLALMLLVGGLSQPNPTAVIASEPARARPSGIYAVTRHPVMWAIGLWALSHLAANGDGASMLLFGALAVLALAGTLAIERRKREAWGKEWEPFAGATSNLPFVALAQGRARLAIADLGWWRIGLAAALYVLLLGAHPHVIGVPAWPW